MVKLNVGDTELVEESEFVAEVDRQTVDDSDSVDVWHTEIDGDTVRLNEPLWLPETVTVADPLCVGE